MFKNSVVSFITIVVAIVFFMQYDPWVRNVSVAYICKYIEEGSPCMVACVPTSISFFSPELIVENMSVVSRDTTEWQWKARRLSLSFSWWSLIKYGRIDVQVRVHGCRVESQLIDKKIAILPHLYQFFASSSLPIASAVKLIEMSDSSIHVHDAERGVQGSCFFSSVSKEIDGLFKTVIHLSAGTGTVYSRKCLSKMSGTISVMMPGFLNESPASAPVSGRIEACVELPHLDKPTCFVTGNWEGGNGRFSIRNVTHVLMVDPFIITSSDQGVYIDAVARCPLSYVWRIFVDDIHGAKEMHGNCLLRVRGDGGSMGELKGQLVIEDVGYRDYTLCSAFAVTMHKINQLVQGQMKVYVGDAEIGGTWLGRSDTGEGSLALHNSRRFTLPRFPYWYLNSGDFTGNFHRNSDGTYGASYQCKIHNTVQDAPVVAYGTADGQDRSFSLKGVINDSVYRGCGFLDRAPYVDTFTYTGPSGNVLFSVKGTQDMTWSGAISCMCMHSLLNATTGFSLQGKGSVAFDASFFNNKVNVGLHLKDGSIRLPYTYNFIDSFDAELLWDMDTRMIRIVDATCGLHTGTAWCNDGQLQFGTDKAFLYMHVPICFNRCLFNVQKDIFAMISGDCVLSKRGDMNALLQGKVTVDRAHIKNILFSYEGLQSSFNETGLTVRPFYRDLCLGVVMETAGLIRVDTPLVQAQVAAHVNVGGTLGTPKLEGNIVVDSGSLLFPYKPLYITKGRICFDPENTFNPTIELRARSNIKKHTVTLCAQGLLHDHQVVLDSNPPLTEEQIISLLLVGSCEDSLNVMMPTLIMHNIKRALWGLGSVSFLDNYFKRTSIPFNINLVPSFTDQTGRGGLRGGIEITVNDRWRALIQKNFSLSEDTRFELEYIFSDDVGVKVIRDERKDIGGEVEMRWKF